MKKATVTLTSASPYSQSRRYDAEVPKLEKETADAYDKRCWREHQHYDKKTGEIFIPPMSIKYCLDSAVQRDGQRIPGKGSKTWSNYFKSGILVTDRIMLGINKEETEGETFYCDPQGKKGSFGGSQVPRKFPVIFDWTGKAKFSILDETITKEIFLKYLIEAGQFVGIGRFRPQNQGFYGRFHVEDDLTWEDY